MPAASPIRDSTARRWRQRIDLRSMMVGSREPSCHSETQKGSADAPLPVHSRETGLVVMVAVVMTPAMPRIGMVMVPTLHVGAVRPAMPVMVAVVIAVGITESDIAEIEADADSGAGRG